VCGHFGGMMKYGNARTLLAGVLLLPAFGYAGNLSYNHVEVAYGESELDVGGLNQEIDGDGFSLSGSLAVSPNWHVFADFTSADFDFNVETTSYRVGGGYNYPISDTADVIARLSYVNVEAEVETPFGTFDADEDGFGVGLGMRGAMTSDFELEGALEYVDLGGDDSGDTSVIGEARYFFTPMFAVGAGVEVGDDVTTYGISARLNFK
jgi:hypothetical protein